MSENDQNPGKNQLSGADAGAEDTSGQPTGVGAPDGTSWSGWASPSTAERPPVSAGQVEAPAGTTQDPATAPSAGPEAAPQAGTAVGPADQPPWATTQQNAPTLPGEHVQPAGSPQPPWAAPHGVGAPHVPYGAYPPPYAPTGQPAPAQPPWWDAARSMHGAGPGAPPPPFTGGSGYWAQGPWQPSPGGPTTAGWPTPPERSPRSRNILTGVIAGVLLVAGLGLGTLIGHLSWQAPASQASPPAAQTTPNIPPGFSFPGSGTSPSVSGSGSASPGSPSDAAAIARDIDPGLVDINVTIGYQNLQGAGTGMVLTSSGEVLTNNHVIDGATRISVTDVGNGRTYSASVLGYARTKDVALIQMHNASGLQTVKIGDSSKVGVGESVVGVGNAGGSGGTPSYAGGSVTALNQSITASDAGGGNAERLFGLIQTNTNIQPGDSGGPLVDTSEHVVGMDTACLGGGFQQCTGNQSFSIPINDAMGIVHQIRSGSSTSVVHVGPTAFLGVEVQDGTSSSGSGSLGTGSGTPSGAGVAGAAIVGVVSGGPAANAGLTQGDTITSLGGHSVSTALGLTQVMLTQTPGATVPVTYVGPSGNQHTTNVTLGTGPAQ